MDSSIHENTVGLDNEKVQKRTDMNERDTSSSEKPPEVGIHSRPEESDEESGWSKFW